VVRATPRPNSSIREQTTGFCDLQGLELRAAQEMVWELMGALEEEERLLEALAVHPVVHPTV
jgi:hypothetical protein